MKYRTLGKTGLLVSEIGFGGWGIGGVQNNSLAYGPTDDQESSLALRYAYDSGITFYDTSDFYGYGHSEQLIGKSLKEVRKNIIIATKVGLLTPNGEQNFSPNYIRQTLDESLSRLQTDYVDLYQLHNPPLETLENDSQIMEVLQDLKEEGKIRAIGISVRSPNDGCMVAEHFGFESIQVNFNLVDRRALENGLLDLCARKDIGVIVRTPLCFGFLTGKYSKIDQFSEGDHRNFWSPEQRNKWNEAALFFATVMEEDEKQTLAQFALRFCLSYSQISTVIPGVLQQDHVSENIVASQLGALSEKTLDRLEGFYKENEFFLGR